MNSFQSNQDGALAQYLEHVWTCLEAGAGPGRSPFTLMQAATIGLDGAPQLRTVVLRQARRARNALWFHADARAPKVAELRADPRISLLAYDPESQLQIRMEGLVAISDDEAERRLMWTSSKAHTLVLYQSTRIPSTTISSPEDAYRSPIGATADEDGAANRSGNDNGNSNGNYDPNANANANANANTHAHAHAHAHEAPPAITDPGYANFSLIRVSIQRFDVLHIQREGHRRVEFLNKDSVWQGSWLVP